ncbi:hypothetical protein GCM10010406_21970 [Streptomyces thermolineatus]|uniref:SHOCT domain-containing protein n=1 Tax=Streptomyces thermolineatus TaxID=44033 RepID=A0ABP5YU94_9ACTN
MYWYDHGMSGWGYALMAVSMIVLGVLAIAVVVVLIRAAGRGGAQQPFQYPASPPPGPPPAEQVLAERYARGEIDEEEYRRRLDTLRAGPSSRPGA